jgi:hypothetical protein
MTLVLDLVVVLVLVWVGELDWEGLVVEEGEEEVVEVVVMMKMVEGLALEVELEVDLGLELEDLAAAEEVILLVVGLVVDTVEEVEELEEGLEVHCLEQ